MKKIINGKVYDTDKARRVADHESGYPTSFDWYEERLYCKRTGEYFLHGEGHANSPYSRRIDQSTWAGGEKIVPLTYEEAKAWAEAHMDADAYEAEFGKVEEGELVHLHISLPADVADAIRKAAKAEGVSVSECIGRRFHD